MKKVTKTIPYERCGYLTYMEYFATGEGFTHEINFCYAETKEKAIINHLDRFIENNTHYTKESRDYFRHFVVAYKFNSKKAKEIFLKFFTNGDSLYKHMKEAGIEMHFKVYYNHS